MTLTKSFVQQPSVRIALIDVGGLPLMCSSIVHLHPQQSLLVERDLHRFYSVIEQWWMCISPYIYHWHTEPSWNYTCICVLLANSHIGFFDKINWDIPNYDIPPYPVQVSDYASCCLKCAVTPGCKTLAYSPSEKNCWPKTSIGDGGYSSSDRIAGFPGEYASSMLRSALLSTAHASSSEGSSDEMWRTIQEIFEVELKLTELFCTEFLTDKFAQTMSANPPNVS